MFTVFLRILVGAGMTAAEVWELMIQEIQIDAGRDPEDLSILESPDFAPGAGSRLGREAIVRIQTARGLRRNA